MFPFIPFHLNALLTLWDFHLRCKVLDVVKEDYDGIEFGNMMMSDGEM